mmetsp:Transcript_37943/g.119092  ORF Transcript_37943/g.119092 Transcript_37943/m.119092 type:complete len:205 (-) Transcript_37943:5-619(-)
MGPRPAATRHLPRISREPSENLPGRDADALGCAVGRFRDMHTCPRRASRVASTRAMPPGPDACCGSDARAPSPRLTAGDWKVQDCRATDEGQRPLQGLRVCRLHQKGGRSQGHRAVQRRPPRRPPAADQPRHRLTLGRRHCRRLEHSGRGCGRQAADSGAPTSRRHVPDTSQTRPRHVCLYLPRPVVCSVGQRTGGGGKGRWEG